MGEGLQNPDLSLEQLYDQAIQSQPELKSYGENFLRYLQEKYPGQFDGVYFEQAQLKEFHRVVDKVEADYAGDHTKIADIVRGRLLVETPGQISIIHDEITAFRQSMGIEKLKDFYAEPLDTHFRTLNSQVRLPGGHVAEFRIDQHDMAIASHVTHDLYEEKQKIERQAKLENRPLTDNETERRNNILDAQRAEFDRASNKGNLDTLLNEKGAATLLSHRNTRLEAMAETFGKLGKNGGVIAGVTLGTFSGAFTLAAGRSKAEAAQVVYEAAVPYGETQIDLAHGNIMAAEKSAIIETASNIGSLGGAAAGAAIGTGIGALGGGVGTGYLTEKIHDNYAQIKSGTVRLADETAESLTNAVQKTKQFLSGWFDRKPSPDAQAAFNALPNSVSPDMPPEVAAL
ncbi:MAG: hypothetical protein LZF85_04330, partial [Nitrosomonas sp.]|uniref:hypothetical protein n=1 Tax=Nitrosomonas sp. TaxID=42353 RepID=UPI0025FC1ABB